jgi:hypothetical protein
MSFIITKIIESSLQDGNLLKRHLSIKTEKHKFRFRMFDDDGNLY